MNVFVSVVVSTCVNAFSNAFVNALVTDALGSPETLFSTVDEGFIWASVEAGMLLPGFTDEFGGPTALSVIWSGQNLDAFSTGPNYERTWSNSLALQLQGHLTEDVGYWAQSRKGYTRDFDDIFVSDSGHTNGKAHYHRE